MTDTEIIDWLEETGAQLWHDRGQWTCFLGRSTAPTIQPTKPTLREAVEAARDAYNAMRQ